MKILLQPKQILGRIVKIVATKTGIILPDVSGDQKRRESVMILIDEIGSEVKNPLCQVGMIIVPRLVESAIFRNDQYRIIEEKDLFVGVGDLSREELEIEGEPNRVASPPQITAQAQS